MVGLPWCLAACVALRAAAAPEDAPLTLFLVVRSKSTNTALRETLRRTWLAPRPGLGYRFFADTTGCCAAEMAAHGDVVARDASWTHRSFELVYPPAMNLKRAAWTGLYSRDWELNCAAWAVRHVRFRFVAHTDDDAVVCADFLLATLARTPAATRGLVFGFERRDAFDNCFVLVSRDVADFFALHYYDTLRPAQVRSGVTYGSGWSDTKGDWRSALVDAGVPLLYRRGLAPEKNITLVEHATAPELWPASSRPSTATTRSTPSSRGTPRRSASAPSAFSGRRTPRSSRSSRRFRPSSRSRRRA